jgi:hypothetical protein
MLVAGSCSPDSKLALGSHNIGMVGMAGRPRTDHTYSSNTW